MCACIIFMEEILPPGNLPVFRRLYLHDNDRRKKKRHAFPLDQNRASGSHR